MYKPYVKKGEWLDCSLCGSAHRRIVESDLEVYCDSDGEAVVLSEEESTQCYKCEPLKLHKMFHCVECNTDSIIEALYDSKAHTICPQCNHDSADVFQRPTHFEKRPTLKGEGAELFNRIKKRNYGSTMPDY